jgi:phytoene dehydrogenase-like protein
MVERSYNTTNEWRHWKFEVGPTAFMQGPLLEFGGQEAVDEFQALRIASRTLLGGLGVPAMALRADNWALVTLLRYPGALGSILQQGSMLTGTFEPFINGPIFTVKNAWLRNWLDALAFSLSGLSANRTSAAALAFVLNDMHTDEAALDYPQGGMGQVVDALVRGVEQGDYGSRVHLNSPVERINFDETGSRAIGVTLKNGKSIKASKGVICNAPVWSLRNLVNDTRALNILNNQLPLSPPRQPRSSWTTLAHSGATLKMAPAAHTNAQDSLLYKCETAEMTGSFIHLHLILNATGLDLTKYKAHYTVMDRSLAGDDPCGELNMVAVSNPSIIDGSLVPPGYLMIHAYAAANEPFEIWQDMDRKSKLYKDQKIERAQVLWRAVGAIFPEMDRRAVWHEIGSPLTHARFLRRPRGTYGSATEDYLANGETPVRGLWLAGDGVFPGIGLPAVALSGVSAANAGVSILQHWSSLNKLGL